MFLILYTSTATEPFSEEKLNALLEKARNNNLKASVTGMLLYCQGTFIQVLEGEKETVLQTFNRINSDVRHTNINVITSCDTNDRHFKEWSMGFKWISNEEFATIEGLDVVDVQDFLKASKPYKILKLLSRNHWQN